MNTEQYVKNDKLLAYLKKEYPFIIEHLAAEDFPKSVSRELAIFYKLYRSRKKPSEKNPVRQAFKTLKEEKDRRSNENEMLKLVNSLIQDYEKKKREERYKDAESKRYQLIEIGGESGIKSEEAFFQVFPRIPKFKNAIDNCEKTLCDLEKLVDELQNHGPNIPEIVERIKIDELVSKLARLTRKFLYEYRESKTAHCWNFLDNKNWQHYENEIGYIYILSNKFMPGLVKIGTTTHSPIERANTLSRGKVDKDKIMNYLINEWEIRAFPEILVEALSKATGVPGDFQVEYWRKTVLNKRVETFIHDKLRDAVRSDEYYPDLLQKEFFIVPSIKYAIQFVEECMDECDRVLLRLGIGC